MFLLPWESVQNQDTGTEWIWAAWWAREWLSWNPPPLFQGLEEKNEFQHNIACSAVTTKIKVNFLRNKLCASFCSHRWIQTGVTVRQCPIRVKICNLSSHMQCFKLMVAQLPLATKNWAGPVIFEPGQVKITIDYIRREIFLTFLGD